MTDRFSGKSFSDPQSDNIKKEVKARKFSKKDEDAKDKAPTNLSELYNKGIEHLRTFGFTAELNEGGDHIKHRILKPAVPQPVLGVNYQYNPKLSIELRQAMDIIPFRPHPGGLTNWYDYGQYNRWIEFAVLYSFKK